MDVFLKCDGVVLAGVTGVFFSDGPYWTEQRRFTLRQLRQLGLGKSSLEGVVIDEVEATLQSIGSQAPVIEVGTRQPAIANNGLTSRSSSELFHI